MERGGGQGSEETFLRPNFHVRHAEACRTENKQLNFLQQLRVPILQ